MKECLSPLEHGAGIQKALNNKAHTMEKSLPWKPLGPDTWERQGRFQGELSISLTLSRLVLTTVLWA